MPRRKTAVKTKDSVVSSGLIDLHFHGAFGIDLMRATESQMDELAARLLEAGVGAFCPTTLSVGAPELKAAVGRIGAWIQKSRARKDFRGAVPIGIHLEGPFIDPHACGAHPPEVIRKLTFEELESLWNESQKTLKIITLAPEILSHSDLKRLISWAKTRKIRLSLGHSKADEAQALQAFELGISGVTHAWNALPFHHRGPGPLGAALGRKDISIELILDQIHVAPSVVSWTQKLHPADKLCFVSDCVPAAGAEGWHTFGPLRIHVANGAARLENGSLAGGGMPLSEMLAQWVQSESARTGVSSTRLLRSNLVHCTVAPAQALGLPQSFLARKFRWSQDSRGRWSCQPGLK